MVEIEILQTRNVSFWLKRCLSLRYRIASDHLLVNEVNNKAVLSQEHGAMRQ